MSNDSNDVLFKIEEELYEAIVVNRPSKKCKSPYVADIYIPSLDTNAVAHSPSLGCCGLTDKGHKVLVNRMTNTSNQAEKGETNFQNPWLVDVAAMLWEDHREDVITFCTYCNKPVDKELDRLGKLNGFQLINQFEESKKKMVFSLLDMMGDKHKKVSGKIITDEIYGAINYLLTNQKTDVPENWANLVNNFVDHFVCVNM